MPNLTLANFGSTVKKRRGNNTLRETAKEIGISPATLMRVEAGRIPDVETFGKICRWLKVDPGAYLGIPSTSGVSTKANDLITVSAHMKADVAPNSDTAEALARMILLAVRRQGSTLTDGDT